MEKPMTLLMIEDNLSDYNGFKKAIDARANITLIGHTNSSYEGLEIVKTHLPEGVILDIELNKGKGHGTEFILELNKLYLDRKPLVFVTTNTSTNRLYNFIHKNDVDLIFYKQQEDYDVDRILDIFLAMRETIYNDNSNENIDKLETINDFKNKIFDRIDAELDAIGIPRNLIGRKYIREAVYYLVGPEHNENKDITALNYLSKKYKIEHSSVSRAIETSINKAWDNTPSDILKKHYTAIIPYNRGAPSPTELLCYYVDKINRFLSE